MFVDEMYENPTDFSRKVEEMLTLQLQEDRLVHQERNTSYQEIMRDKRYFYALLDEFGELNHELKPQWCWWKKTVGEVDHEKMIEEFSDVTHFILSYHLACFGGNLEEACNDIPSCEESEGISEAEGYIDRYNPIQWIITELLAIVSDHDDSDTWRSLFGFWIILYKKLGLDFDKDVYEPYIKKNAVNQNRMHMGY